MCIFLSVSKESDQERSLVLKLCVHYLSREVLREIKQGTLYHYIISWYSDSAGWFDNKVHIKRKRGVGSWHLVKQHSVHECCITQSTRLWKLEEATAGTVPNIMLKK